MITENLSTLKIHKLTQEQYDRELAAGRIDPSALYLTPDEPCVTYSSTAPLMDGTASVGTASSVARSDHRHPTDTSRASKTELDNLKTIVDGKASSSHTHSEYMTAADPVGTGSFSMNRMSGTTVGDYSSVLGKNCEASGKESHAEGYGTVASGDYSHAEGYAVNISSTTYYAGGNASHVEGYCTEASGNYSHAEGSFTKASGNNSHAEGNLTKASGTVAHAEGYSTVASNYQHSSGKCNTEKPAPSTSDTQDATNADAIFMIGCGTSSATKNAFRVSSGGKCFGSSAFEATGADFAELFEWADGNPNNEDRRGLFITLDGEKIRLANANDDYIGVISGDQAFVGNSASEEWHDKYLTDVFGTKLSQEVEVPEEVDEVTGEVISPATTTIQYVLNPEYNSDEEYVMRENRKEWGIVGLLGQIVVIDDGTCVVGGRVEPSIGGVGTASNKGYRVMKRIDKNHIKVLVK